MSHQQRSATTHPTLSEPERPADGAVIWSILLATLGLATPTW
jgi:hypothetical protein